MDSRVSATADATDVSMCASTLRDAKDIMVCLRYGIGDVVMQLPVLAALRIARPNARITAIGAAPAIELLEGAGLVDDVVGYGRWGIRHLWDPGADGTAWQVAAWLEEAGFDVMLDGGAAPEPIWQAIRRTGLLNLSLDDAVLLAAVAGGANGSEALARAVRSGWGLPVHPHARPAITLSSSEREFARMFRKQSGSCGPLVGFCPVASSNLKRWPEFRFAAVADWVIENTGHEVVLFGSDLDETVASMRRLMSHGAPVILVPRLHLRRVAAVLAECAALVSNDTGLMHMASAVGTPVIAVFGPTSPRVYLPRGRTVGLAVDLDCPHRTYTMSPPGCWASERCLIGPDNCTLAVPAEAVIASLEGVLRRSAAAAPTQLGSSPTA
jgi:ADP-heptose:LPS heptosyltransferase